MNPDPVPPKVPEEVTIVLEYRPLSPEARERMVKRLLLREAMRKLPRQRFVWFITSGDDPPFILVDESGRRERPTVAETQPEPGGEPSTWNGS
jgi:hypothetical protein